MPWDGMQATLQALQSAALSDDTATIKRLLQQLVPGYQPGLATPR